MLEFGTRKVLKAIQKIKDGDHSCELVKDKAVLVKINRRLYIEINARLDGTLYSSGTPYIFELYAIRNGVAEDCITQPEWVDMTEDVNYLIRCWK